MAAEPRRVPTPLVLAAASGMLSIGVVAFLLNRPADDGDEGTTGARALVAQGTAERAAESFLDAWRKRDHAAALQLSTGDARDAVRARQRADAALGEEERKLKEQLWDAMASTRLAFVVRESGTLEGKRVALHGVAEGEFLGQPYRRRVDFVVAPGEGGSEERWQVEHMSLGEILSDVPDILQMPVPRQRDIDPLE
jgi:hypothetical protein